MTAKACPAWQNGRHGSDGHSVDLEMCACLRLSRARGIKTGSFFAASGSRVIALEANARPCECLDRSAQIVRERTCGRAAQSVLASILGSTRIKWIGGESIDAPRAEMK